MSQSVTFIVPGQPQGKGRARFGRGRTYTPTKTVAYEGLISLAAQSAMAGRELLEGPLRVSMWADMSIPKSASKTQRALMLFGTIQPTKRPDADNILKAVADACNGVVYRDDSQITLVVVGKRYAETPGIKVTIEQVSHL